MFDANVFKTALAKKGLPASSRSAENRIEKIQLFKLEEMFRPAITTAFNNVTGSDIARRKQGVWAMKKFIVTYFYLLGVKDCISGVSSRFYNDAYLWGYAHQYELEAKQSALCLH